MQPLMRWQSVVLVVVGGALAALLLAVTMGGGEELATLASGVGAHRVALSRPSPAAAVAGRVTALSRGARLVAGGSSRYASTYRRADGSMLTRVSTTPVNYRDANGRWRAIDATLVARDGEFVNRAGAQRVRLPRLLSDGVQVSAGTARVEMRLLGAAGTAHVRGERASYPNVMPGVSAIYDSQRERLREQLVLSGTRVPSTLRFALTASPGLRARQNRGGDVVFSRAGRTVFVLPASFAFPLGHEASTHAVRSALHHTAEGWTLTVAADQGWVHQALRRGPVVIDPTVQLYSTLDCRIENSSFANSSYCSDTALEVGSESGGFIDRSLLKFDVSSVPKDAVVLNADFGLQGTGSAHSQTVEVHALTRAFTSSVTWNKYNGTSTWTTAGGDYDSTAAASATVPTTSDWVDFYPTKLVAQWVNGTTTNNGMLLKATSETTGYDSLFQSYEGGGSSTGPELDVVWSPRAGQLGSYTLDSQRLTDRASLAVNVANGNLLLSNSDVHVTGTGLDLDVAHYHNSLSVGSGLQGAGISGTASLGKDVHLQVFADGSVAYFKGDGVALPFFDRTVASGTASFTAPADLNASLTQDTTSGDYTLTFNRTEIREIFNSDGQLTAIKDRNDNQISLDYYSSGGEGLSQITDTQGRTYDVNQVSGDGSISDITDPTGRVWDYTYGSTGSDYLTDYEDPETNHTLYGYDTSHRLNQITTPQGSVIKITYDGTTSRVASVMRTTNVGHTTGPTTSYAYSTGSPCTTGQNKTVITDPNSHDTTYCADAVTDRVALVKDALQNQRATTYTSNGDTNDLTDTPGGTGTAGLSTLHYDLNNNPTSFDGAETEHAYAEYYTASDTGGGGGPLAKFRVKDATNDQGTSEFYTYDSHGNLTDVGDAASSPRNKAHLTYNANGTLGSATDGESHTTSFGYDTAGNLTTITPPTATVPTTTPLAPTTISVDALSRVHTVKTGSSGPTRTLTYDKLDRVTRVDVSDGSYFTYTYDDDGNLTARGDYWGNSTSYTVDPLGRRTHEGFPGSKSNDYTYDNAGNLTTAVDAAGTVTYTYDNINRPLTIVSPTASGSSTDTVSYSYDDPNRTQTMTLPGSTTEKYSYNKSGLTTNITVKNSSDTVLRSLAYDYTYRINEAGFAGSLIRKVTDQGGQKTTYTYKDSAVPEDVGRLVKARVETSTPALIEEFRYSYDKAGNRTQLQHDVPAGGGGVTTTTSTYAYNADNQLCWAYTGTSSNTCGTAPTGATSYSYDANGHGNETAAGSTSYSYDTLDRATSLAGTTAGYLTPDNSELVSFGTTTYQNNLLGLSRQFAASATTTYVRDPSGQPVSQRTSSAKQFFLNDALGSTIALTDTSGSIVRSYSYDPDGNATTSGSGATTDLKYAGGHQTGSLYHYGARYYDPSIGRWTQQDPITQYADLTEANRYVYAGGDPINMTDESGTVPAYEGGVYHFDWAEYRRYLRQTEQCGTYCHIAKCVAGIAVARLGGAFAPGLIGIGRATVVACGAAVVGIP